MDRAGLWSKVNDVDGWMQPHPGLSFEGNIHIRKGQQEEGRHSSSGDGQVAGRASWPERHQE